jgi:hypothetical protein
MKPGLTSYKRTFLVMLSSLLLVVGCGVGSKTLRITVDKEGRGLARQERSKGEQQQTALVVPAAGANRDKTAQPVTDEEVEGIASDVLNLVVNAQAMMQRGDYIAAEKNILNALELIPGRELYLLLAEIYYLQDDKTKADSCRALAKEINKVN